MKITEMDRRYLRTLEITRKRSGKHNANPWTAEDALYIYWVVCHGGEYDRYYAEDEATKARRKLERQGIRCKTEKLVWFHHYPPQLIETTL